MDRRPLRDDRIPCIVSSHGSGGDFLPTLAVGAALHRRGHEVRLVANPFYASRARHAGLELVPAGEHHDLFERIERTPAYLNPANFGMLIRHLVVPHVEASYPVFRALLRDETTDVIVANDAGFGAIWAAAEAGCPSVLVQPGTAPSPVRSRGRSASPSPRTRPGT
jgi:rhamnosyltransferase subunit B